MSLPCLFPLDPFYHRWNNPPETRASPRHSLTLFPSVAAQGQGYWLSMAQADTITNICQGSLMCMFPTRYLILRGKKIAKYNLYYKRNFNFFPQNSKVIPTSGPSHLLCPLPEPLYPSPPTPLHLVWLTCLHPGSNVRPFWGCPPWSKAEEATSTPNQVANLYSWMFSFRYNSYLRL